MFKQSLNQEIVIANQPHRNFQAISKQEAVITVFGYIFWKDVQMGSFYTVWWIVSLKLLSWIHCSYHRYLSNLAYSHGIIMESIEGGWHVSVQAWPDHLKWDFSPFLEMFTFSSCIGILNWGCSARYLKIGEPHTSNDYLHNGSRMLSPC